MKKVELEEKRAMQKEGKKAVVAVVSKQNKASGKVMGYFGGNKRGSSMVEKPSEDPSQAKKQKREHHQYELAAVWGDPPMVSASTTLVPVSADERNAKSRGSAEHVNPSTGTGKKKASSSVEPVSPLAGKRKENTSGSIEQSSHTSITIPRRPADEVVYRPPWSSVMEKRSVTSSPKVAKDFLNWCLPPSDRKTFRDQTNGPAMDAFALQVVGMLGSSFDMLSRMTQTAQLHQDAMLRIGSLEEKVAALEEKEAKQETEIGNLNQLLELLRKSESEARAELEPIKRDLSKSRVTLDEVSKANCDLRKETENFFASVEFLAKMTAVAGKAFQIGVERGRVLEPDVDSSSLALTAVDYSLLKAEMNAIDCPDDDGEEEEEADVDED